MGTYDITIYTATCDVGDCDATFGDDDDWSDGWSELPEIAGVIAVRRGGWTKVGGVLICTARDREHDDARSVEADDRPKPGPGQLALTG